MPDMRPTKARTHKSLWLPKQKQVNAARLVGRETLPGKGKQRIVWPTYIRTELSGPNLHADARLFTFLGKVRIRNIKKMVGARYTFKPPYRCIELSFAIASVEPVYEEPIYKTHDRFTRIITP
jgi:hypothetical protein